MLLLTRSLQMVVAALFQRGGVSFPSWDGHLMDLHLSRESCWLLEKRYLYTDIVPSTLPRKTASGQLHVSPRSWRIWRLLRGPGSQESMQSVQRDAGKWFPPTCLPLLAVALLGLFIVLSQPALGSEMLIVEASKARAVAKTALQSSSWRFLF